MKRTSRVGVPLASPAFLLAVLLACRSPAAAGDPFLTFDFEDGDLAPFFNPTGLEAINLCGDVLPAGPVTAEDGEVLMTNDEFFGIALFGFRPSFVAGSFPEGLRDYSVRVRVNLETVNELSIFLRARVGVDEVSGQLDSTFERGYGFSLFPQDVAIFVAPEFPDGIFTATEWTGCHDSVDHPEWPSVSDNFARFDPGVPIVAGDWYWVEVSVQGEDNGGPALLAGRVWPDGEDPPAAPQLLVVDPDGLPHTPETLTPETSVQVFFGTSFDLEQQPLATARVDDLTVSALSGCPEPPLQGTRTLWGDRILAEGKSTALFEEGGTYSVALTLDGLRPAGDCDPPASARITEVAPPGWEIGAASEGGTIEAGGSSVSWEVDLSGGGGGLPELSYTATASGTGIASFTGSYSEPASDYIFLTGGEGQAASAEAVAPVSDFGSIQHWLILGSFTRDVGGANPGDAEIRKDYLTDGEVTEATIRPRAGDTVEPDYGLAASSGLAPDALGRNPGGVPTWVEWRDFDDADDRIDFESVYGDLSDVMAYAVTYLDVLDDTTVNFGVSSDDSVHILLDGETLHANNIPRGALDRFYQDTPFTHPSLGNVQLSAGRHILMVKVFEGGGEHNFRVGFLDAVGLEIPGGPDDVEVSLEPGGPPSVRFVRGDPNSSGDINLSDGVGLLNALFRSGSIACADAGDSDDSGNLNLTDAVIILRWLFAGGREPREPSPSVAAYPPADCGPDRTDDALDCQGTSAKCEA